MTSFKDVAVAIAAVIILLAGGFIGFIAGNYYGYSNGIVDGVKYQYNHTMKLNKENAPTPQGSIAPIVDPTGATAVEVIGSINDSIEE